MAPADQPDRAVDLAPPAAMVAGWLATDGKAAHGVREPVLLAVAGAATRRQTTSMYSHRRTREDK